MPRNDLIQVRRDTASNWTASNPILASGELGLETNTGYIKIGNGSTVWSSLPYLNMTGPQGAQGAQGPQGATGPVAGSANQVVYKDGSNNASGSSSLTFDGTRLTASALTIDTNTLYVDATNNRVGIVNATPAYALDVNGTVEATQFLQGTDYLTPYTGFRNAIINGDFRINQRAFSSTTTNGTYGFDRWYLEYSGGTSTYSSQSFTVGSPAVTGYEAATFARVVSASQSLSSHYTMLVQRIEDVRTFANTPVMISFWAKASSGTPSVAIELQQNFGSGGSPSAQVNTAIGKVILSTSWTRYTVSYSAVPSISGKTIGTTANTSFIGLNLWTSAGSTYDSRTGTLGLQSATIDFWGIQVERGSVATPFEQRPIGAELALCQRYFQRHSVDDSNTYIGSPTGSGSGFIQVPLIVQMRTAPTFSASSGSALRPLTTGGSIIGTTDTTSISLTAGAKPHAIQISFSGSSGLTAGAVIGVSGNAGGYFDFSAEF